MRTLIIASLAAIGSVSCIGEDIPCSEFEYIPGPPPTGIACDAPWPSLVPAPQSYALKVISLQYGIGTLWGPVTDNVPGTGVCFGILGYWSWGWVPEFYPFVTPESDVWYFAANVEDGGIINIPGIPIPFPYHYWSPNQGGVYAPVTYCSSCFPQEPPPNCPGNEVPDWSDMLCEWICENVSPIVFDISGRGLQFSGPGDGVWPGDAVPFDFFGNGVKLPLSWTAKCSPTAFLALDRNHNGKIDNAKELFGNITLQPPSPTPNGFLALAEFDTNHDGVINSQDDAFSQLLMWTDTNHDGVSQPEELTHLSDLGVKAIHLDYVKSGKVINGNQLRYCAKVEWADGRETVACDAFLKVAK